jgi:hypothetical protein
VFSVAFKLVFAGYLAVVIGVSVVALAENREVASASEAEDAARNWEGEPGNGTIQPARLEADGWEVDILRPDGSLVELTFSLRGLELMDVDEELGPGGTPAHDEVRGPLRRPAIRKALEVTGPGRVTSVERDAPDEIEVNVKVPDGRLIEVELDSDLHVHEKDEEDPGDE